MTIVGGRRASFDIPSLDGIRALAVMLVFLAHAGLNLPGSFGVTVFFFLSGYLITTLLRLELERTGGLSLRDFYLRRALRILPPMYVVLVAAVGLTVVGLIPGTVSLTAVALQSLHLTNYRVIDAGWWNGIAPGTWIYWSLAVEEHFYLLFPLVYLGIRKVAPAPRRQAMWILGLCAAVLAWRLFLVIGLDVSKERTYIASDTRMDSILFGCALAVFGNPALDSIRVSGRRLAAIAAAAVATLAGTFLVRDPVFLETLRYTLQGLALFPLFVIAIRYPAWGPVRLLNQGWMRRIGILSYVIYLVHPTIIYTVQQRTALQPVVQGVLALVLSLLTAYMVHRLVERPCADLRRKLAKVRRDGAANPERIGQGSEVSGEPAPA